MDASVPILDAAEAREVLRVAQRIAIVGASPCPCRASNSVMAYLLAQGYQCVPVNPTVDVVLGQVCYPSLEAAVAASSGADRAVDAGGAGGAGGAGDAGGVGAGPFDIVDVFRRPEHAPEIARSAVATGCGTLWLQLGVISPEAARIAHEGGLKVVMDRCTAIDHRALR